MVLDVLTDPDGFFEERAGELSLWTPFVVVIVATVVKAIGGLLQLQKVLSASSDVGLFQVLGGAGIVIGTLVGVLIGWVVFAAVFHLIAMAFDGQGSFTGTLAVTGWGYLPLVIGGLVSAVLVYVALGGVTPPELQSVPQGGSQQAVQDAVQANVEAMGEFFGEVRSQPAFLLSGILGLGFTLWQGYIWSAGIEHVTDLDRRQSLITVGIPVGIAILWNAYNLL